MARRGPTPATHPIANQAMNYFTNTTIIPSNCDGFWQVETIDLETARSAAECGTWESAVGHESTAAIMSAALRREIPLNRIQIQPRRGDTILAFKLKKRAPEGVILTEEQIKEIGYEFVTLKYFARFSGM
jgi:hypothetical protein